VTASYRVNLKRKLLQQEIADKLVVTLVRNLKEDNEFDLSGIAMPPGYRLVVKAVVPEPGETVMVRVHFKMCDDGHIPKIALMNGDHSISVIRR
jgi:hypothetical protein